MVDNCLSVGPLHAVDRLIFINRVVVEMCCRDFLEDTTVVGTKAVPDAGLHQAGLARPHGAQAAFDANFQCAVKNLESFLFALVEVRRMLLARQLNDNFFAVVAVDAVDNYRADLAELLDTVMV